MTKISIVCLECGNIINVQVNLEDENGERDYLQNMVLEFTCTKCNSNNIKVIKET